jgi:protein SCO1/2
MRIILLLFCAVIISCETQNEVYDVRGTIRSIDNEKKRVLIAHDTIPDLMMPMVMPFQIKNQKELDQLSVGDSVHFKFVWSDTSPYAETFKIVAKGHLPENDEFFRGEYDELQIGQSFDDVTLLGIDSNEVKLSDSDGKYRFISYIFTRCPMPTMCPAVVMKTSYLADSFADSKSIDFVLVSFDYKYDLPSILKQNYGASIAGYDNLKIWSSAGKLDDVYKLVKQSGGDFWGVEKDKIGHTLRSVLISPDRELLASWSGEEWKVQEVERGIQMFIK